MSSASDQNLLLGILALQLDFIEDRQLLNAMREWVFHKNVPLDEILSKAGAITDDERKLLGALVAKHLEKHQYDTQQSLASVSSVGTLREELNELQDADVHQSVACLTRMSAEGTAGVDATVSRRVGVSTSEGTRFRVLRFHDKGGLGRVYVARDEELGREVALKEINPGKADDPYYRARFTVEAEVTGGLEHPGVVPVYGLGQYADGRPFYAMRFIRGDSLKEAIARYHQHPSARDTGERKLALRQLLGRFVDVCHAIEYAHSRGVLHRDLKPGNIMLGKYGETLVVDWGLAKVSGADEPTSSIVESALLPRSASGSAPTEIGTAVGTPGYMSPEQAAGRLDLLGSATDVYGLGATLYHMLTGRSSQTDRDREVALQKVERGEFPAPRRIHPDIPRPLEAICLKAMAVRPDERYRSARALADDIESWMADEPVTSFPEPLGARFRRWLRKHPRLVATLTAGALVGFVGLIAVAGVTSVKNRELATVNRQLLDANTAEREARALADTQRNEALHARAQAEAVADYLVRVFRSPDPAWDGRTITVAEVLDRAATELEGRFADQPEVRARLMAAVGQTYEGLGLPKPAIRMLRAALSLQEEHLAANDPDLLVTRFLLGRSFGQDSRLEQARTLLAETIAQMEACLGSDDVRTLSAMVAFVRISRGSESPESYLARCARTRERCQQALGAANEMSLEAALHLAIAERDAGHFREAADLARQTLQMVREHRGDDELQALAMVHQVAGVYSDMGDFDEAIRLRRETLTKSQEVYGDRHPVTLRRMNDLAQIYERAGQYEKSVPLMKATYECMRTALGQEHINTLICQFNLGRAYCTVGRHQDGIPLMKQATETTIERHGRELSFATAFQLGLAATYNNVGQPEEAIPLLEQALERQRAASAEDHPSLLATMHHLASAYASARQYEAAVEMMERTLARRRATDDPETAETMSQLAAIYEAAGQPENALTMATEAVAYLQRTAGPDHPRTHKATAVLGAAYISAGQPAKAIPLLKNTIVQQRERHGDEHPFTQWSMATLANAYSSAKLFDDAITVLRELVDLRRANLGPDHPYTVQNETQLITLYETTDRFTDAEPLQRRAVERLRAKAPHGRDLASSLAGLGSSCLKLGKYEDAEKVLRECLTLREELIPDSWLRFNAQRLLGAALSRQQRFAEAEPLLLEGYAGLQKRQSTMPANTGSYLTETAREIVALYRAWNKPERARAWTEKGE